MMIKKMQFPTSVGKKSISEHLDEEVDTYL
jgi:hypothetical protein